MSKFIQLQTITTAKESADIFALDETGRIYVTYWDKHAPNNHKWQQWIPLPAHPDAENNHGED